jgi:hypothetical protein
MCAAALSDCVNLGERSDGMESQALEGDRTPSKNRDVHVGTGDPVEHKRSWHPLNKACEANIACQYYDKGPILGNVLMGWKVKPWKEIALLPKIEMYKQTLFTGFLFVQYPSL